MMIFLLILGLLVAIVILFIKYFMAYAKLTSHSAYNKAAAHKMDTLKKKDSNITCDYCGARIDTSIHRVCPNCGAAYGNDEEWTSRYKPDQEFVDESADEFADAHISKAQEEANKSVKKIKKILRILFGIFVFLIILVVISAYFIKNDRYAKDDELNKYSFDNYVKEEYYFYTDETPFDSDNLTLYSQNDVEIKLTGIYKDVEDNDFKIEYHLINNSDSAKNIKLRCVAINGYADDYIFEYDLVKANDDVVKYDSIYSTDFDNIESMVFGEIKVTSEDYEYDDELIGYTVVKTNYFQDTKPIVNKETLIFENEYIGIYKSSYSEEDNETCYISIENKSDYDFLVSTDEAKLADSSESLDIIGLSKDVLPAKCVYNDIRIKTYVDVNGETFMNDLVVNYSFKCDEKPEISFSTGFVGLNK